MRNVVIALLILIAFEADAQWIQKTDNPVFRHGSVAFAVGNKFYVGLGRTSGSGPSSYLNDFWEYNPLTNNWTSLANFPGTSRFYSCGFVIGNFIYVGTGTDYLGSMKKDFYKYDVATNTWTTIPNYPGNPTKESYAFAIYNKGYIGGGTSNNAMYEYNPGTNTWSSALTDCCGAIEGSCVFVLNNEAYVVGGSLTAGFQNVVSKYNGSTWSTMAPLPVAGGMMSGVGFAMNNKGYIALGHNSSYTNAVYEYNPGTNTWTTSIAYPGAGRTGAVAAYNSNNEVYVGMGDVALAQDWWTFTCSQPTINVVSSNSLMCTGETAVLTSNGASTYTWSTGSNASTISISPTVTTNYTVNATGNNGCIGSTVFTQTVLACIGIKEVNEKYNLVNLFPNPATNILNIENANIIKIESVVVLDIAGRKVLEQKGNATQINIESLEQGIYQLLITSEGKNYSSKFIKE